MNWFERNLVNSQINNKHTATATASAGAGAEAVTAPADKNSRNMNSVNEVNVLLKSSNNNDQLNALKIETHDMNAIRLANNVVGQVPTQQVNPTISTSTTITTVIAITKPPILSEPSTTQFAPAWKSLIHKIVNSNKNDIVDVNPVKNVDKAWSTVLAKFRATTLSIPIKLPTQAPATQDSSKSFVFVFFFIQFETNHH